MGAMGLYAEIVAMEEIVETPKAMVLRQDF